MRRSWLIGGLLVMALGAVAGCSSTRKYTLTGTEQAVGADARLEVDVRQETANSELDIRTTNLPPPERLDSDATAYVVWQRKDATQTWSRVGTLAYSAKSREGRLMDVTVPQTQFELKITPEPDAEAAFPSNQAVFSQEVK